jgi:hypothetical protein
MRNAHRIFVENPGRKDTLSTPIHTRRLKNNSTMYLIETGLKMWIDFIWLRI